MEYWNIRAPGYGFSNGDGRGYVSMLGLKPPDFDNQLYEFVTNDTLGAPRDIRAAVEHARLRV